MATLYKLTNQEHKTRAGFPQETQWGEGVTHEAKGSPDQDLCTDGWIHAYTDPLLAVLLNPIHANINKPVLWECEGEVGKTDKGLKVGCRKLKTLKVIPLPVVTTEQVVKFAILCAKQVCKHKAWNDWADKWLSGQNRSQKAPAAAWTAAVRAVACALSTTLETAAVRAAWAAEAAVNAKNKRFDLAILARKAVS